MQVWRDPPDGGRGWLSEAIANVREGLVPHLEAPRFVGQREPPARFFPSVEELDAMPYSEDGTTRIEALDQWQVEDEEADEPGEGQAEER
jgi:hypothetical protein